MILMGKQDRRISEGENGEKVEICFLCVYEPVSIVLVANVYVRYANNYL